MKITFINGANESLGYKIARRLIELGQTVIVGARVAERGRSGARLVPIYVRNDESIYRAAEDLKAHEGRIDVLTKKAGILGANRPTDDIGSREAAELIRRESCSKRRKACVVAFLVFIAATNAQSPKEVSAFEIATPIATANAGTVLIERVAAAYAVDVAGVLAVRSRSDLAIKAPIFGRHITGDNWYVFENGNLAASSHKTDPRQPPLHDPYRAMYLSEYTYRLAPCETCARGTSAVSYESQTRDVAHAHGIFIINTGTHISSAAVRRRINFPGRPKVVSSTRYGRIRLAAGSPLKSTAYSWAISARSLVELFTRKQTR